MHIHKHRQWIDKGGIVVWIRQQVLLCLGLLNKPEGWVYIRVYVPKTWSPKYLVMDLTFGLKIRPNLENWFLKPGGVFS